MIGTLLHRLLGTADPRTPRQVKQDVEDEFAHHLDALRDELRDAGVPEAELETTLAHRFGDPRRYATICIRLALTERIMLQRINLALLVIVGLAVLWIARGTDRAAEQNLAILQKLSERIDSMAGARSPAASLSAAAPAPSSGATIFVSGSVARPGSYAVPTGTVLTLRRLLVAASIDSDNWARSQDIEVARLDPASGANKIVFTLSHATYLQAEGPDFQLLPGDLVRVP